MQLLRGPEKNVSNIYISPAISGFGTVKTVIMLYCCFLIKTKRVLDAKLLVLSSHLYMHP
jgi:hypothetical protein